MSLADYNISTVHVHESSEPDFTATGGNATNNLTGTSESTLPQTASQKIASAVALGILYLATLAANAGIVHYERIVSDAHRTLLNKLAVLASLYSAAFATAFQPVFIVRILHGRGLPFFVCWLWQFCCASLIVQLVLVYNELVVLHYTYVCRLSTVGVVKEELLMRVFVYINAAVGTYFGLISGIVPRGKKNVIYHYCPDTLHLAGKSSHTVRKKYNVILAQIYSKLKKLFLQKKKLN